MYREEEIKNSSLYRKKETNMRVDVSYVIQRLEEIVKSEDIDGCILNDAEEFLNELKENLKRHKGENNG
tara:strand:+ start:337 stop:543 length:207 start_codon:yes stop_codon:yes gene_type:complete